MVMTYVAGSVREYRAKHRIGKNYKKFIYDNILKYIPKML